VLKIVNWTLSSHKLRIETWFQIIGRFAIKTFFDKQFSEKRVSNFGRLTEKKMLIMVGRAIKPIIAGWVFVMLMEKKAHI
jgi:hypothetical protein